MVLKSPSVGAGGASVCAGSDGVPSAGGASAGVPSAGGAAPVKRVKFNCKFQHFSENCYLILS